MSPTEKLAFMKALQEQGALVFGFGKSAPEALEAPLPPEANGALIFDPVANAAAALNSYHNGGWQTHTSSAYKTYLELAHKDEATDELNLAGEIVFDPKLHPHGYHGHFIPTHTLKDLHPGDVFHTKSGKVFQVEKHTEKGTKVKTVNPKTGELKGGYTVFPHIVDATGKPQPVELIQGTKKPGTSHKVGELSPGTFIKTAKGKKFKIKGHGKWTTVLPVDEKGVVSGKHTVLPKATVVTIHHADESHPMTPETVDIIADAAKDLPPATVGTEAWVKTSQLQPGDKIKYKDETWIVNELVGGHVSITNEGGWHSTTIPANDATMVEHVGYGTPPTPEGVQPGDLVHSSQVGDHITYKVVAIHGDKADLQVVEGPGAASAKSFKDVPTWVLVKAEQVAPSEAPEPESEPDATTANTQAHLKAAEAASEFMKGAAVNAMHEAEVHNKAIDLFMNANYPAGWNPATKWGQAYADAYTYYGHNNIVGGDLFKAVQTALKEPAIEAPQAPQHIKNVASKNMADWGLSKEEEDKAHKMAAAYHSAGLGWPNAYTNAMEDLGYKPDEIFTDVLYKATSEASHAPMPENPFDKVYKPGLTNSLKAKWEAQNLQGGSLAGALEGALGAMHQQNAMNAAVHGKKVIGDILPTKFPKAVPQAYAEGVGQHTKVVIRSLPGNAPGALIVRVAPDGHEQTLETVSGAYASKTALRKLARAHAAPHEAIEEAKSTWVKASKAEDLKPNDLVYTTTGWRAQVVSLDEAKAALSSYSWEYYHSAGYTPMRFFGPEGQLGASIRWLQPEYVVPAHVDSVDQMLPHGKAVKDYAQEYLKAGGVKDELQGTVRKAAPSKYSPYLHSGWDPEHLVNADIKDALEQLKVHGYLEIKPRQKDMVRVINKFGMRMHLGTVDGKITSIEQIKTPTVDIEGTAHDYHDQLAHLLETGGDLASLDPRTGAQPEATTSFVRHMLYDMAIGKKNGIQGSGGKVKSDDAYRIELESEGVIQGPEHFVPQAQQQAGPIVITVTSSAGLLQDNGVTDPHFHADQGTVTYDFQHSEQLSPEDRAVLWSIFKRRGMAQMAIDRNKGDLVQAAKDIVSDMNTGKLDVPAPEGSAFPTMRAYVEDNMNHWSAAATQAYAGHVQNIDLASKALAISHAQEQIDERRKAEGTVKEASDDFDLPTWDQTEFKPQTHEDIWNLIINDPSKRDVPAFYTGGVFQDSVLQHRQIQTEGKVPLQLDGMVMQRLGQAGAIEQANSDKAIDRLQGSFSIYGGRSLMLHDGPSAHGGTRTIEYVYHQQPPGTNGGAPTSQRGLLRMRGYEPQEAAARLKELGLLGDLEPTVPFDALMRGPRRHGAIDALHPAYVRGEAPLPKAKKLLRHGISHPQAFLDIVRGGGLRSIAERWRLGIHKWGASPSGDMRSGIDHCNFVAYGEGAVGSGASVQILMRPSAFLRRDITLAPHDFGGSNTRYSQYRNFLNQVQGQVGVPKTNLYVPVDPKVRQHFLTNNYGSSAEFNIGPGLPIEDWETIGIGDAGIRQQVDTLLEQMLASGQIKSRPKVVSSAELPQHQRSVG